MVRVARVDVVKSEFIGGSMRYAVIKNNTVVNTIIVENSEEFSTEDLLIQSDSAGIGDRWDGKNFIASPPPPSPPNWNAFNQGLLLNAAYNKVTQFSVNQVAVRRLETIAISLDVASSPNQDYTIFIVLWNAMIDGLPVINRPTSEEIDGWKAIALTANMPFSFAQDGKIVI